MEVSGAADDTRQTGVLLLLLCCCTVGTPSTVIQTQQHAVCFSWLCSPTSHAFGQHKNWCIRQQEGNSFVTAILLLLLLHDNPCLSPSPGDTYYATPSYPNTRPEDNASDDASAAALASSRSPHPSGAADTSSVNDPAGGAQLLVSEGEGRGLLHYTLQGIFTPGNMWLCIVAQLHRTCQGAWQPALFSLC
jgi:hypothetical protein